MSETLIKRASKWVGNIPSGWSLTPLKYVCTYNDETLSDKTDPTFEFDYIDISSVNSTDEITSTERLNFADAPSRARRVVRADDIIMSTVRTYLRAVAIIPESKNQLIASTGFLVIRALQESITPEYLGYVIKSDSFISAIEAESVGVSYPAINASEAVKNYIPVPPLDVQRSIVAFLDSRCKPINEAIARHRMIIDKLEDYRKAVITKAVTKGLDESAPMKDSGIEWIGSMPANWSTTKLKFLCMSHNGVDYNSQDLCNQNDDNSLFVIRSSNLVNGAVVHGDDVYINKPVPKNMLLRKGDLVIVRTNGSRRLVGKCALVTKNEKATAGAFMLICRSSLNPYIYWVLNSSLLSFHRGHFDTTTINQMSNEMLKNMIIPLPPHEQMIDIMTYLDYKCAAINEGVNRQEQVIARLEEYRRSLIFHAVTGRIDCTGGAC